MPDASPTSPLDAQPDPSPSSPLDAQPGESNDSRRTDLEVSEVTGSGVSGGMVVQGDWGPWLGIDPHTRKRTVIAEPVWYRAGDMERAVVFQPGYRTDRQTYGQHGMDIKWLLRGPRGVTQFVVFTGWVPGAVGGPGLYRGEEKLYPPMGADVGYHAMCPQFDGQSPNGTCDYMDDGPCFYDGSGLQAEELLGRFVIEGEAVVWRWLTERHDDLLIPPVTATSSLTSEVTS